MGDDARVVELLASHLGLDLANLSESSHHRIYDYYLPVCLHVLSKVRESREDSHARCVSRAILPPIHCVRVDSPQRPVIFRFVCRGPVTFGISAPQGCGKTTLVAALFHVLTELGLRVASASIDDFYLTRADQVALAERHDGNPLLLYRGNAGSHDLALGRSVLESLKGLADPGATVAVPRYDKSLHAGKGDRAPESAWQRVEGPLDVVLFEGWMLGFQPLGAAAVSAVSADLVAVDHYLHAYQLEWDALVDQWVVVEVGSPEWVFDWRLQAEHDMKATGKPGMTDDEVRDFCERFQPAYRAYLPKLYSSPPPLATEDRVLRIKIAKDRSLRSPIQPHKASIRQGNMPALRR